MDTLLCRCQSGARATMLYRKPLLENQEDQEPAIMMEGPPVTASAADMDVWLEHYRISLTNAAAHPNGTGGDYKL